MLSIPHGISLAIQLVSHEIESLRARRLVIALDGHSSSGKSTLSKDLSQVLDIPHIDTGAMYRAVTLYFLRHDIDQRQSSQVTTALQRINVSFEMLNGQCITMLNGEAVEQEIRTMEVSSQVSNVAAIPAVRTFLVSQQRAMAQNIGVIMDGRDIGTVVFPNADVKLFVTASTDVRTTRRHQELINKGQQISRAAVLKNLETRDRIDSTRTVSPLRQAEDAILLDTTELDRAGMLAEAIKIIHQQSKK